MSPAGVLVVYATAHGSTRGVAERIATRLREAGNTVALAEVRTVEDLTGRDAVVFGSPVYDQAWLPEARAFIRRRQAALAAVPLWLFSVGTFGDGGRLARRIVRREPRGIDELRRTLAARDYRVFAGVIDRHQWPGPSRLLFHAFGGRFGDRRDWAAIDAWAMEIAREVGVLPEGSGA